jgi:hypothetical protein
MFVTRKISSCLSVVCLYVRNISTPTKEIFMKFHICLFFENLSGIFKIHFNPTQITGTLHEYLCTFMTISRSFLLRMRNFSTIFVDKIKTHIMCSITFSESRAFYDLMRANTVQPDRAQINYNMTRAHSMLDK